MKNNWFLQERNRMAFPRWNGPSSFWDTKKVPNPSSTHQLCSDSTTRFSLRFCANARMRCPWWCQKRLIYRKRMRWATLRESHYRMKCHAISLTHYRKKKFRFLNFLTITQSRNLAKSHEKKKRIVEPELCLRPAEGQDLPLSVYIEPLHWTVSVNSFQ